MKAYAKQAQRKFRRKMRVRNIIRNARNPRVRLSVHKTTKHISVQIIDDLQQRTLASASSLEKTMREQHPSGGNVAAAKAVGALIAERAKAAGVADVAFDRGPFRYHGRIKALADAAREGGLKF